MARLFNDAVSDGTHIDQAVVSGYPFAVSQWIRRDASIECVSFTLVDKDSNVHSHIIQPQPAGEIRVLSQDASGSSAAFTISQITNGVWAHVTALFVSATDRRVFLNAAGKVTDATSRTPLNLDRTAIGYWARSSPVHYFSGDIAEVAMWDLSSWTGATDSDKADLFETIIPALASGYSPMMFPLGIQAYWPLIRGLNDIAGGYNVTASGTVVSNHTRIINPFGSQVASLVTPVAAGGIMTCNTGYWGSI